MDTSIEDLILRERALILEMENYVEMIADLLLRFRMSEEEDYPGDSLPDPRVSKEELDRELEGIAAKIAESH